LLGRKREKMKMISIHLGAGASLCAIKEGKSIDTTMGFTPLEGLMMTTRSGDIDPGIIFYLQRIGWSTNKIEFCLNRESGVLGVSGISNEMKKVVEEMRKGSKKAKEAVEMFVYRVRKYLGAYYLVLGGAEAICFTGGIGENSPLIRHLICENLDFLGIELDKERNEEIFGGKEGEISLQNSKVKIFVIPGREKLLMARVVSTLIKRKRRERKKC
jgi:acetate kinase